MVASWQAFALLTNYTHRCHIPSGTHCSDRVLLSHIICFQKYLEELPSVEAVPARYTWSVDGQVRYTTDTSILQTRPSPVQRESTCNQQRQMLQTVQSRCMQVRILPTRCATSEAQVSGEKGASNTRNQCEGGSAEEGLSRSIVWPMERAREAISSSGMARTPRLRSRAAVCCR